MSKSIRIRTTPNGGEKRILVPIEQEFDFIEILSLKITQEEVYRRFCADYGVVVGRVSANGGFGVPNTRVSIFIPLDSEDENNSVISTLYPYKTPYDKDANGIRYNLLPNTQQDVCHTPVGTFPSKTQVLDNDDILEIYEKYYKYTTTTNHAGVYHLVDKHSMLMLTCQISGYYLKDHMISSEMVPQNLNSKVLPSLKVLKI
jgi:hypothetical protein